jgi:type I restriction enzyme S subunit
MELKKGFKDSDVGVIPEDWQLKTMKDICWVNQGLQIPIEKRLNQPNGSSPVYITIQYLNDGKLVEYIDDYNSSVFCNKADILMTRTGNTGMVISNVEGVFHNNFFKINYDKKKIEKEFLICYLKSPRTQKDILTKAGTSTIPDLNHKDFYSILIPVPTLLEQNIIASTLSDADAYINSLEKLIEKKHQIKQGAMQELLKPKDGWVTKVLGDIGKTFGGLSGKTKDDFIEGAYPYIPFMNIMSNPIIDNEYFDYVNIKSGENQNLALKGDLFFNGSSETPEEVGMCSVLLDDIPNLYLNSFCFGFRIKNDFQMNGLYLSYYFRSKEGRKLFFSMAQGATRYNLSKSNFNKLKLSIPPIKEQNEIAELLFDFDSDIKIHEVKLEKAKSIKQGIMQNLLTGKIRLI